MTPLVLGTGDDLYGDAAAGLLVVRAVARQLAAAHAADRAVMLEVPPRPLTLLGALRAGRPVVLIDAIRSPGSVGHIETLTAHDAARYARLAASSGQVLAEVLTLAASTGRLPADLTVHLVHGRNFGLADNVTPEVGAAVAALARRIVAELGVRQVVTA